MPNYRRPTPPDDATVLLRLPVRTPVPGGFKPERLLGRTATLLANGEPAGDCHIQDARVLEDGQLEADVRALAYWCRLTQQQDVTLTVELAPAGAKRELMDSAVATAPRVRGWFPNEGQDREHFDLPLWIDEHGWLRLGLPKVDPQHAGDMDMVALRLSDLLVALGRLHAGAGPGGVGREQ